MWIVCPANGPYVMSALFAPLFALENKEKNMKMPSAECAERFKY